MSSFVSLASKAAPPERAWYWSLLSELHTALWHTLHIKLLLIFWLGLILSLPHADIAFVTSNATKHRYISYRIF